MFKNLKEFGHDIVIEMEKISFVQKTTRPVRMPSNLFGDIYLINIICDGAFLTIDFREIDVREWNKCYEFLKNYMGSRD